MSSRRLDLPKDGSFANMKVSVIIPTLNEARHIGGLVSFIRKAGGESVAEVIVVDAQSTDGTAEVARHAGAVLLVSDVPSRAVQMNLGARYATGDVLYFVHADVKIVPSFVEDITRAVAAGWSAGCYRFAFDSNKMILKINSYFTRFDRMMCRGGDQTMFVIREVFDKLHGFDTDFTIMEEYEFIGRLRKHYTFGIIPKSVKVSARKYETNSWLRVQVANLTAFMMFFLKRKPSSIKAFYKRMLNAYA